jgi:hypothetical protein
MDSRNENYERHSGPERNPVIEEDVEMNLEDLELEVEPAELKTVPRGKTPKPNPMTQHLERSWEEERSLSVKVPAENAVQVGRSLRKAAMPMGIGVSVQYQTLDGDVIPEVKVRDLNPDVQVRVVFRGRELIQAARRESDED